MSARDPAAVLREVALSLGRGNDANLFLRDLATTVEVRPAALAGVVERLDRAVNDPALGWSPSSRAAFALAREALGSAGPGVEGGGK